jgi:phosphatidylglycerophosphatase A
MKNTTAIKIATFFGVGYSKFAPGTAASLVCFLISIPLVFLESFTVMSFLIFGFSMIFGTIATKIYTKTSQNKDPKEIVIDEVAGYFIGCGMIGMVLIDGIKLYGNLADLKIPLDIFNLFLLFVFFRILDIFKPYPILFVDRDMKNPLGVMLDDVFAGSIAAIFVLLCNKLFILKWVFSMA